MSDAGPFDGLRERYEALLQRLPRPRSPFHAGLPTRPTHNGDAHVEIVDGRLEYVVTERGAELQRRVAQDADELLYWLFDDVTATLAWHERSSWWARLRGHDPRRRKFRAQVALLARLDPAWAERKRRHHAEVLARHPFRDSA